MFDKLRLFGDGGFDPTKIDQTTIIDLIWWLIQTALAFAGVVAFLYILVAGLQYVLSAGVESKQTEAKNTIRAAIIGLLIIMFSYAIVLTLLRVLGFNDTIIESIDPDGVSTPLQQLKDSL